jgi:6-phosphogluconolactonase
MIKILADESSVVEAASAAFRVAARAAIASRGRFAVALTGGRVALSLYDQIAVSEGIDWSRVALYWGDERAVPPDHPDSNYGLAQSLVSLERGARVHRMMGEADDLQAAARSYEQLLPMSLDLVQLGVGPDGHVASLFPGHALLGETWRRVAVVTDSPKPPPVRLTVTLPVLHDAQEVHFIVVGKEKAQAVAAAVNDTGSPLPAALAARGAKRVSWFVDRAAASLLGDKR